MDSSWNPGSRQSGLLCTQPGAWCIDARAWTHADQSFFHPKVSTSLAAGLVLPSEGN